MHRLIKQYPLLSFFALAFVISWGAAFFSIDLQDMPVSQEDAAVVGLVMLLGPCGSGLVLTTVVSGRTGFKNLLAGLIKWRCPLHGYLFALFLTPITVHVLLFILSFVSTEFTPLWLSHDQYMPLILNALMAGIVIGTLEELGWTGFATQKMIPNYSVFLTGIIIGFVWGLWHWVFFWDPESISHELLFSLLIARLFAWLPPYRILMVWLYVRTESILLSVLMHASLVVTILTTEPMLDNRSLIWLILAKGVAFWGLGSLLIVAKSKRISR